LPAVKVTILTAQRLLMDRIKSQAVEQLHQQLGRIEE
jgi:hypothetical protein